MDYQKNCKDDEGGNGLVTARVAQEDHLLHVTLVPHEQQAMVWKRILDKNQPTQLDDDDKEQQHRDWPTYDHVLNHLSEADYRHNLTCPYDTLPGASCPVKTLCPFGVVCCVRLEIFPNVPYTGLLQACTSSPGILRLSSAMKPPSLGVQSSWGRTLLYATGEKLRKSKLFPCAALKVFRQNRKSGNLLFGGSKVGQRESDFFAHCVCTSMTEQMPRPVRPFVRKFWTYSDYPLSLGVSDFCRYDSHGEEEPTEQLKFPFAVILKPHIPPNNDINSSNNNNEALNFEDSFDCFLDRTMSIPSGKVLYDIFACSEPTDVPDSSQLQRIGCIRTTSEMRPSSSADGLFFRHQRKEEDYALRPDWPQALKSEVTINQGKTTGSIGKLAGWKLFEQHIAEGIFVDYENKS